MKPAGPSTVSVGQKPARDKRAGMQAASGGVALGGITQRGETALVVLGIAAAGVGHHQALHVMADIALVGHANAAVQMDRPLAARGRASGGAKVSPDE